MRKFLYTTKNIPAFENSEDAFSLEYYIVDGSEKSENLGTKNYGIEVVRHQQTDGIIYSETKISEKLCFNEESIMQLIKLLSDNTVTPFIMEEILSEIKKDEKYQNLFTNHEVLSDKMA